MNNIGTQPPKESPIIHEVLHKNLKIGAFLLAFLLLTLSGVLTKKQSQAAGEIFNYPSHNAIDSINHRFFVSDAANNRVLVFNLDLNNTLVDKIPDYVLGQPNFTSFSPVSNSADLPSGMNEPHGLAYDSVGNRLFVVDRYNSRVMVFDVSTITNGEPAVNVIGQPDLNSGGASVPTDTGMYFPYSTAYDDVNNRLFVGDLENHRVLVFDVATITNGEPAINVLGVPHFFTAFGATINQITYRPLGLAYDSVNNRLFMADEQYNQILVFDVSTITDGEDAINVLGMTVPSLTQSGLSSPRALSYDSAHNRLFVTDPGNARVLVFDAATITDREPAINVLGQSSFTTNVVSNTLSGMNDPSGVAYDSVSDRLFVTDSTNHRVMIFDVATITDGESAIDVIFDTSTPPPPPPPVTDIDGDGVLDTEDYCPNVYGTFLNGCSAAIQGDDTLHVQYRTPNKAGLSSNGYACLKNNKQSSSCSLPLQLGPIGDSRNQEVTLVHKKVFRLVDLGASFDQIVGSCGDIYDGIYPEGGATVVGEGDGATVDNLVGVPGSDNYVAIKRVNIYDPGLNTTHVATACKLITTTAFTDTNGDSIPDTATAKLQFTKIVKPNAIELK
jgi:DNA-binding beta-propeller fold protein YncE